MTHSHSSVLIRKPSKAIDATITVPGSKSITNRMLIAAALADGESTIRNASISDDTTLLINALNNAGLSVQNKSENTLSICGMSGIIPKESGHFFLGNAGTSIRFMTSLLTLGRGHFIVDSDDRMRERPIQELIDALNNLGANIRCIKNDCSPIDIVSNGLGGGNINIKGDISSQFISSLLLIAPYTKEGINLHIGEGAVSKRYIDMTVDVMKAFNVEVERDSYSKFTVKGGQRYKAGEYCVDGDAASANYLFAIAAVTKGTVRIGGMRNNYTQGEGNFIGILQKMGCSITKGKDYVKVAGDKLQGIDVDMNDMPDSAQTLACVSLFAGSSTTIRNISNLRVKETDRITALYNELRKVGAVVEQFNDGIKIIPAKEYKSADIETYNDHRMVMSFAVAGASIDGLVIKNPDCVSKSFPSFFSILKNIGFTLEFR